MEHGQSLSPFNQCPSQYATTTSEINMGQLELFHHFTEHTYKVFINREDYAIIYRRNIIACAFSHPFLMHEMLAFAALHLSFLQPDRQQFLRHIATSLQAKALSGLDNILLQVNADNCLAILFFSHMLGVHSFCDTFATADGSFRTFLSRLIQSINLLRGVQTVIYPWWDALLATDIGEIIAGGSGQHNTVPMQGVETRALVVLLQNSDLDSKTRMVYEEVVEKLQRDFDVSGHLGGPLETVNVAFAWLVTLPMEFILLLDQESPQALIMLAYYAVLLHRRRHSWVVGDAGQFLISSILVFLRQPWETYLAWPKAEIFTTSPPGVIPASGSNSGYL